MQIPTGISILTLPIRRIGNAEERPERLGSKDFVEKIQQQLGVRAKGRSVVLEKEGNALKEAQAPYSTLFEGKKEAIRLNNSYFLDINNDISMR